MSSGTNLLGTLNIGETAFSKCLIRRYVHSRKNIKKHRSRKLTLRRQQTLIKGLWHTVTAYKKTKIFQVSRRKGGKKTVAVPVCCLPKILYV